MAMKTATVIEKKQDIRAKTQLLIIGKIPINYPTGEVEDVYELVLDNGHTEEVDRSIYYQTRLGESFTYDDNILQILLYTLIVSAFIIVPLGLILWAAIGH